MWCTENAQWSNERLSVSYSMFNTAACPQITFFFLQVKCHKESIMSFPIYSLLMGLCGKHGSLNWFLHFVCGISGQQHITWDLSFREKNTTGSCSLPNSLRDYIPIIVLVIVIQAWQVFGWVVTGFSMLEDF